MYVQYGSVYLKITRPKLTSVELRVACRKATIVPGQCDPAYPLQLPSQYRSWAFPLAQSPNRIQARRQLGLVSNLCPLFAHTSCEVLRPRFYKVWAQPALQAKVQQTKVLFGLVGFGGHTNMLPVITAGFIGYDEMAGASRHQRAQSTKFGTKTLASEFCISWVIVTNNILSALFCINR